MMRVRVSLLVMLFCAGVLLLFETAPYAQSVTNPTYLTFVASPDDADVTQYTFTVVNGASVVDSGSLGKPTPGANNVITVPVSNIPGFGGVPKGVTLYLFVYAMNGAGTSVGVQSNPFVVAAVAPAAVSNVRMQ